MLLHLISVSTLMSKMNDCTRAHIHFWPHSTIWLLFAHVLCQHKKMQSNWLVPQYCVPTLKHKLVKKWTKLSRARKNKTLHSCTNSFAGECQREAGKKKTISETLQSNKSSVSRLLSHRRIFWITSWRLKKPPPRQNQIQLILLGNQSWPHGIQLAQNRMQLCFKFCLCRRRTRSWSRLKATLSPVVFRTRSIPMAAGCPQGYLHTSLPTSHWDELAH